MPVVVWLAGAPPALAHTGLPPTPQAVWAVWDWSLALWLGFGLTAWVYARGWHRLEQHRQRPAGWQTASFIGGLALAFVALVSPLDSAGSALLSAHMVQHLLLILGAAPLLAISQALSPLLVGLPKGLGQWLGRAWHAAGWLRRDWALVSQPAVAGVIQALGLWAWHLPVAYQSALGNQWVHDAEHLTFLGTALILWWAVLDATRRDGHAIAIGFLAIFVAGLQSTVLALLFTVSASAWYPAYAGSTAAWGLSPLQDQQLAGAIMWVPSAVIYLVAIVGLMAAWLRALDRLDRQHQPEWLRQQENSWEQ